MLWNIEIKLIQSFLDTNTLGLTYIDYRLNLEYFYIILKIGILRTRGFVLTSIQTNTIILCVYPHIEIVTRHVIYYLLGIGTLSTSD